MHNRPLKGKSIISFPNSYTIVDIETTGLDFEYCEIIEVAAVKYLDGFETNRFVSLVQPHLYTCVDEDDHIATEYVDEFITSLTGITNELLTNAPIPQDVIPKLMNFISDDIIVGYNINIDINFLYDAAERTGNTLKNDFVDVMRLARKLYPEMKHHRLKDMIEKFQIDIKNKHRALDDALATAKCLEKILQNIDETQGRNTFIKSFQKRSYNYRDYIAGLVSKEDVDITNPIYGKTVVFTGALSSMTRKEALALVANLGGVPDNSVTAKTNFLVVGNEEFVSSVKNGKTNKMLKADRLKEKGNDIETISENTFLDIINR